MGVAWWVDDSGRVVDELTARVVRCGSALLWRILPTVEVEKTAEIGSSAQLDKVGDVVLRPRGVGHGHV